MILKYANSLFLTICIIYSTIVQAQTLPANKIALTPPMGWNSYNCYGATVRENEVKANADYIAKNLKKYGWEYVVVDYCWFYPHPPNSKQSNPPQYRNQDGSYVPWLAMDSFGRLLPDIGKFPAAQNGQGFKSMADYVHGLGLKFGIHVMRGIPRQAVWGKTPIKGETGIDASMIADTTSKCPWLNAMFGVDMNKPGAQSYYNSLANLYAEWGVDFIKIDDIDLNEKYPYYAQEVSAMHKAIDQCGRPIVLSLSLNMKRENRSHIIANANMFRITKDFWDEWHALKEVFELAATWTDSRAPGHWPDNDMLQIGRLSKRGPVGPERDSKFTNDELLTHMTLWIITQSPLMIGGDLLTSNDFSISLFKNAEALKINQNAEDAHQLYRKDDKVIWVSRDRLTKQYNIAMFNTSDKQQDVSVNLSELGIKNNNSILDVWENKKIKMASGTYSRSINPHGCVLIKIK
jgi:hypothetical protein